MHNHFRLRHAIRGRAGLILISRECVVTHPRERDDRVWHFVHRPTHCGAVLTATTRTPSSARLIMLTLMPSRPSSKVLPLDKLAPFCALDA